MEQWNPVVGGVIVTTSVWLYFYFRKQFWFSAAIILTLHTLLLIWSVADPGSIIPKYGKVPVEWTLSKVWAMGALGHGKTMDIDVEETIADTVRTYNTTKGKVTESQLAKAIQKALDELEEREQ